MSVEVGDLVWVSNVQYTHAGGRVLGTVLFIQKSSLGTYRKCKVMLNDGSHAWRMMFELERVG